jgi:hypothetical protein
MGDGEQVFRVLPLIASLASLPLFWVVVHRRVPAFAALVALGVFAVHGDSIYFAGEFKQYSVDMAVGLGMTAILLWWGDRGYDRRSSWWTGAAAAISGWFSLPAALIVGPGMAWHWALARRSRDASPPGRVGVVLAAWLSSTLLLVLLVLRPTIGSSFLHEYWRAGFLPWDSVESGVEWILQSPRRIMHWPMGFHSHRIGLFLSAVGTTWLLLNRKTLALFILGPILASFLAGVFHLYPFGGYGGRTILFLVPFLILLLSLPLGWAAGKAGGSRLIPLLASGLLVVLMIHPLRGVARQFRDGIQREELWPVLQDVQRLMEPDETLYIYHGARFPLLYYGRRLDLTSVRVVNGSSPDTGEDLPEDLDSLRDLGRVWFVASWGCAGSEEEVEAVTASLRQRARVMTDIRKPGARAVLFDFFP